MTDHQLRELKLFRRDLIDPILVRAAQTKPGTPERAEVAAEYDRVIRETKAAFLASLPPPQRETPEAFRSRLGLPSPHPRPVPVAQQPRPKKKRKKSPGVCGYHSDDYVLRWKRNEDPCIPVDVAIRKYVPKMSESCSGFFYPSFLHGY